MTRWEKPISDPSSRPSRLPIKRLLYFAILDTLRDPICLEDDKLNLFPDSSSLLPLFYFSNLLFCSRSTAGLLYLFCVSRKATRLLSAISQSFRNKYVYNKSRPTSVKVQCDLLYKLQILFSKLFLQLFCWIDHP